MLVGCPRNYTLDSPLKLQQIVANISERCGRRVVSVVGSDRSKHDAKRYVWAAAQGSYLQHRQLRREDRGDDRVELGAKIGVAGVTIQRYKAGHVPPESRTVEILAEAAVTRGYLNCAWLREFLQTASYPTPAQLLDWLCSTSPAASDLP